MRKKYHELIHHSQFKKSFDFFNTSSHYNGPFKGMNLNQATKYWEGCAKKTVKIESSLKVYLENSDLLYGDTEVKIIEELLHHPMKNKLRLIHDGSWYTHRIWFHVDKFHKTIIINPEICWVGTDENSEFRSMSKQMDNMTRIKEKIQFLMDNFKVVYIQMHIVENRSDIETFIVDDISRSKWIMI